MMRKAAFAIGILNTFAIQAQDGQVDPTFANNAVYALVNETAQDQDMMTEIAVMSDGRIVLAGTMFFFGDSRLLVVRLMPDGTRDNSFGTGGAAVIDLSPGGSELLLGMVVQGEKIILAGQTTNFGTSDFFIMRLNADGEVDLSFGAMGVTIVDVGVGTTDYAMALRMDGSGRLLMGGSAADPLEPTDADLAVLRFTADGELDLSFNGTGKRIWPVGTNTDVVKDIVFGDEQRIYLAGEAVADDQRRILIAALNDDGSTYLDFGGNMTGLTILPADATEDAYVRHALMEATGNIMVVGSLFLPGGFRGMMAQVGPSGSFTGFNGGGVLIAGFRSDLRDIMKVQGGYLVCGYDYSQVIDQLPNALVARIGEDALPVASFGEDGYHIENVASGYADELHGIVAHGTGHAVVVGTADVQVSPGIYGFAYRITVDGLVTDLVEMDRPRFNVHPNPTNGLLQLPGELRINALVEVVDMRGAVVMTTTLDCLGQLDVRSLAPGPYTLLVDRAMNARFMRM